MLLETDILQIEKRRALEVVVGLPGRAIRTSRQTIEMKNLAVINVQKIMWNADAPFKKEGRVWAPAKTQKHEYLLREEREAKYHLSFVTQEE